MAPRGVICFTSVHELLEETLVMLSKELGLESGESSAQLERRNKKTAEKIFAPSTLTPPPPVFFCVREERETAYIAPPPPPHPA